MSRAVSPSLPRLLSAPLLLSSSASGMLRASTGKRRGVRPSVVNAIMLALAQ